MTICAHSLANILANLNALLAPKSSMMLGNVIKQRNISHNKKQIKTDRQGVYSSAPAGI